MTAHFGLPVLGRPALAEREVEIVAAGRNVPWVDELVDGDVWQRTRALRRLQAALVGRRVCSFLVDSRRESYARRYPDHLFSSQHVFTRER